MSNRAEVNPDQLVKLLGFLVRYYSHRPEDLEAVIRIIQEAEIAGRISADEKPIDLVKRLLFDGRDDVYFQVRALALEVLQNPRRVKSKSNGEGLALALLFDRKDWLGDDTWACAAKRVGNEWLNAIVQVQQDFKWMNLPIRRANKKKNN